MKKKCGKCVFFSFYAVFWKILHTFASEKLWPFCDLDTFLPHCGIYQGRESIIDFKQSNKPKKAEWIGDYKLQMVAYAMAHNCVYGTDIDQGVILMCTPDNFFQKFTVNGREFRELKWEWLGRVNKYYELLAL